MRNIWNRYVTGNDRACLMLIQPCRQLRIAMLSSIIILSFLHVILPGAYAGNDMKAYACEDSSSFLTLSCREGDALNVAHARYGRLSRDLCNTGASLGRIFEVCFSMSDVKGVAKKCDNTQTCTIPSSGPPSLNYREQLPRYIQRVYTCTLPENPLDQREVLCSCNDTTLAMSCGGRDLLAIKPAYQEPLTLNSCNSRVTWQLNHVQCVAIVLHLKNITERCNGKTRCHVPVERYMRTYLRNMCEPVPKYLEVSYKCTLNYTRNAHACEGSLLNIACPEYKLLRINTATYGHALQGECSVGNSEVKETGEVKKIECMPARDIAVIGESCDGKSACNITFDGHTFAQSNPCEKIPNVLHVNYECIIADTHITTPVQVSFLPTPVPPERVQNEMCTSGKLDAICRTPDGRLYAFYGDHYVELAMPGNPSGKPQLIRSRWNDVIVPVDAVLYVPDKAVQENPQPKHDIAGHTLFYKDRSLWKYKYDTLVAGFPKLIGELFPGLPDGVDSAFSNSYEKRLYFTKGTEMYRFEDGIEENGSPLWEWFDRPIPLSRIDAAIEYNNEHTLFFVEKNFYHFDRTTSRVLRSYSGLTEDFLGCNSLSTLRTPSEHTILGLPFGTVNNSSEHPIPGLPFATVTDSSEHDDTSTLSVEPISAQGTIRASLWIVVLIMTCICHRIIA